MMRWSFGRGGIEGLHDGLHHHVGAGGIVSLVLMIILWAALVVALVFAIRALILYSRHRGKSTDDGSPVLVSPSPRGPTATGTSAARAGSDVGVPSLLATLQERYARGEIDRDEFLQRRQDLGLDNKT